MMSFILTMRMDVPPTPAARFATLILWLTRAVVTKGLVGLLPQPLVMLIVPVLVEL